jgi:hypothetical protein
MSVDFLSLIERGINSPSFASLERIAKRLRLQVTDLFTFRRCLIPTKPTAIRNCKMSQLGQDRKTAKGSCGPATGTLDGTVENLIPCAAQNACVYLISLLHMRMPPKIHLSDKDDAPCQFGESRSGRRVSCTKHDSHAVVPSFSVKPTRQCASISVPHFPQGSVGVSLIRSSQLRRTL